MYTTLTSEMEFDPMHSEDYIRYLLAIVKRGDGITPEEFDRIFGWARPKFSYAPNTLTSGVSKLRKNHGAVIEWRDGKYCLISINPAPEPTPEPMPEPTYTITTSSVPAFRLPSPAEDRDEALMKDMIAILRALLDTRQS